MSESSKNYVMGKVTQFDPAAKDGVIRIEEEGERVFFKTSDILNISEVDVDQLEGMVVMFRKKEQGWRREAEQLIVVK